MDGSMFIGTWWSLVPPLLAIVLALVTKEVYSSLFIGVAAGAQSNHINHVTTQMQYAAVVAVISFIGYIIAGFVHIWWVVLGISLILLLLTLTVIKKITSSKEEETKAGA